MTEVAKINTEKQAEQAMAKIREKIDYTIINDIYPPITKIDSGELDSKRSEGGGY